ncbi:MULTISPECIES: hypothetical protein [Clostridium]|uniref:Uncharacterized protein n=1 Tax=Clostridium lapidicellarium TaxID=3240931 RepID=A0ABV4DS21_9CLOT|nr:hypothetical protein [Clostridiales bacterium]
MRLNYAVEDKSVRKYRIDFHISTFLIGITNMIFSLISYFIQ